RREKESRGARDPEEGTELVRTVDDEAAPAHRPPPESLARPRRHGIGRQGRARVPLRATRRRVLSDGSVLVRVTSARPGRRGVPRAAPAPLSNLGAGPETVQRSRKGSKTTEESTLLPGGAGSRRRSAGRGPLAGAEDLPALLVHRHSGDTPAGVLFEGEVVEGALVEELVLGRRQRLEARTARTLGE